MLLCLAAWAGAAEEAAGQDAPLFPRPWGEGASVVPGAPAGGVLPMPPPLDTAPYPAFRVERELTLVSLGAAMLLAGSLTPLTPPEVPPQGFDPVSIRWSVDRRVLRPPDATARVWSDVTDGAALVLPLALAVSTDRGGARWERLARTAALQAEVLLLSQGSVLLAKRLSARPRPCTYLPEAVRSPGGRCDPQDRRTFQSLPSGHASSAWAGATLALTEHLFNRPDGGWVEHAGVGALGGLLATTTSALRVTAGEHFPTDVLLGSGVGILTGAALPILHRGERPWPSWGAVFQGVGGVAVGSVAGLLVVNLF